MIEAQTPVPHRRNAPQMFFPGVRRKVALLAVPLLSLAVSACSNTAATPNLSHTAAHSAHVDAQAQQPNFLIIVADDLGFGDVGFNGSQMPTPNIDRIAKLGMPLDHFYVSALCSPSRAGLLTGRYPNRFGIMGDTITPGSDFGLDPQQETIAQMLGRAGYERRSFLGKWHLGHRSLRFHPMSFGFTSFYGHYNGAIDYFTHQREGQPDWHRDHQTSPDKGYSTDLLTQEAVQIISTPAPKQKPWLMWLAYNAPHGPLQAQPEDLAAVGFDPAKPRFKNKESKREGSSYGLEGRGNTRRQTVLAMIRALDRGIGKVLDALERSGQLDNTVILFTSDNGGAGHAGGRSADAIQSSNGPLRGWKFQHYEGGVRVAAAIAWPGHLKPRTKAGIGPMSYVDVLPTFAGLAHAPLDRKLDGIDVSRSLLTGSTIPPRVLFLGEDYTTPPAYGERGPSDPEFLKGRAASALVDGWKLVGSQLFNIRADPYEKTDLAPKRPELVKQIEQQVSGFAALRKISRDQLNATHLPPLRNWELDDKAAQ